MLHDLLCAIVTGDGLEALMRAGWCSYDGKWGSAKETKPVGQFEPNAWGLFDMHGNVSEWCADWYGPYDDGDVEDPRGPNKGDSRVMRGGCWFGSPRHCRSACRQCNLHSDRDDCDGFRVLLCPDDQEP